jgi:hypothetical protein
MCEDDITDGSFLVSRSSSSVSLSETQQIKIMQKILIKVYKTTASIICGDRLQGIAISVSKKYSGTQLKQHQFMRHHVFSIRYAVVPINSSLSTIKLYSLVITTLVYDTKYSVPFMTS